MLILKKKLLILEAIAKMETLTPIKFEVMKASYGGGVIFIKM